MKWVSGDLLREKEGWIRARRLRSLLARDSGAPVSGNATYYTITDEPFFVGTVALLNSLRLTGHEGEFVALDCGLTPTQQRRLAQHARVVPAQRESGYWGYPLKPFAWHPEVDGVVVMIDSDMLITGSLDPLLRDAARGQIGVFVDLMAILVDPPNRSFSEWQRTLGLAGPLRQQPYVNAGLIAFSVAAWPHFLDRWRETCRLAADASSDNGHRNLDWSQNPFAYPEQDALNAILMSEVAPEALALYDYALAPITQARESVQLRDLGRLRCVHDSRDTLLLHNTGRPKQWEPRAWAAGPYTAFSQLLPRVLFSDDVALRLDPGELPRWLRPGLSGKTIRLGVKSLRAPLRRGSAILPRGVKAHISSQLRGWAGDPSSD